MEMRKMRHGCRDAVRIVLDADRRRINIKEAFGHRYRVDLHDHDTGTHLRITAVLGEESLLVWDYHSWKSSGYEFNNKDKTLGLQVDGPWADGIDDILDSLEIQTQNSIAAAAQAARDMEMEKVRAYVDKAARFRNAFTQNGA